METHKLEVALVRFNNASQWEIVTSSGGRKELGSSEQSYKPSIAWSPSGEWIAVLNGTQVKIIKAKTLETVWVSVELSLSEYKPMSPETQKFTKVKYELAVSMCWWDTLGDKLFILPLRDPKYDSCDVGVLNMSLRSTEEWFSWEADAQYSPQGDKVAVTFYLDSENESRERLVIAGCEGIANAPVVELAIADELVTIPQEWSPDGTVLAWVDKAGCSVWREGCDYQLPIMVWSKKPPKDGLLSFSPNSEYLMAFVEFRVSFYGQADPVHVLLGDITEGCVTEVVEPSLDIRHAEIDDEMIVVAYAPKKPDEGFYGDVKHVKLSDLPKPWKTSSGMAENGGGYAARRPVLFKATQLHPPPQMPSVPEGKPTEVSLAVLPEEEAIVRLPLDSSVLCQCDRHLLVVLPLAPDDTFTLFAIDPDTASLLELFSFHLPKPLPEALHLKINTIGDENSTITNTLLTVPVMTRPVNVTFQQDDISSLAVWVDFQAEGLL